MSEQEFRPFDVLGIELSGKNLVEASAGTGKTHAIATLVLRLVLARELEPSEILVMTFTEAATAELRGRVRRRLNEALGVLEGTLARESVADAELLAVCDRHAGESSRLRLRRAVDNVDEAPIATIHGFCHGVLHEQALGTGTPFAAELAPDLEDLYDDVLYDFWHAHVAGNDERVAALAEAGVSPAKLRRVLDEVRKNPRARLVPEVDEPLPALCSELIVHARRELSRRKDARGVLGFEDLLELVAQATAPPHGERVNRALRARYKAVLVDEFQDTDPVQAEIIERAFGTGDVPLFLIGDPKQAIYGFRGADVFTYLAAQRGARRFTMLTNWRSDRSLVAAVNQLFSRENCFLIPEIGYRAVAPRPAAVDAFSAPHASGGAALELLFVPREDETKLLNKSKAERLVADIVAADAARLLRTGSIEGKRVVPSDLAVLTRSNAQCFVVQDALRRYGIHAVVLGDKSVFESDEALDVELVLAAVLDPTSAAARKRALATVLLGKRADAILALDDDALELERWLLRFQRWLELWQRSGFMRMFRALLRDAGCAEQLLGLPDGERRLTNVLHLAELLERAASEGHLGPAGLVRFLAEQRREGPARAEHAEIRLESDAEAVRILTVHKSKGLEFSVVYCPYLWAGSVARNDGQPRVFHAGGEACLDVDFDKRRREPNLKLVKRELLAEDLRIAYVALTRAKRRCTVVWGGFNGAGHSATGLLLFPDPCVERGELLDAKRLERPDAELLASLERVAAPSNGAIAVRRVAASDSCEPLARGVEAGAELRARAVERPIRSFQRTESFSGLTHHEEPSVPDELARDHDEEVPVEADGVAVAGVTAATGGERQRIVLADFPRGRRAGDFFHSLFEELDFQSASDEELLVLASEKLEGFGFGRGVKSDVRELWLSQAVAAMRDALETPLGTQERFRLADVAMNRRFNELEFRVPVALAESGAEVTAARLAEVLRRFPSAAMPASYAARVANLGFSALTGYLKGFIDLVFEHRGRFYVVDYKTNHLGDYVDEYDSLRMRRAMAESHYFLQYHLYTLAVDRFLRRFPGYDYETGFGGVYYLFVKGMRPGGGNGVFFEKPPRERLSALSDLLEGKPV